MQLSFRRETRLSPRPVPQGRALRAVREVAGLFWTPASFFLIELYLRVELGEAQIYGLSLSALWTAVLTAAVWLLPRNGGRVLYGLLYFFCSGFAVVQVGCCRILGHMIWLSDISHAGEGADYTGAVFGALPPVFWVRAAELLAVGAAGIWLMPSFRRRWFWRLLLLAAAVSAVWGTTLVVQEIVYYNADDVQDTANATVFRLTENNYGIYTTMYDARQTYGVCGYYQLLEQDLYRHHILPLLPAYQKEIGEKAQTADEFLAGHDSGTVNDMTGLFAGKNVVMVLMESMDDFSLNDEDTPTICRLMREGINFTNFYTPVYSSIHTFNTEFCVNTGFFLPTSGKSALYYSGNDFSESLPFSFRRQGYTANAFHYNSPAFYNRGAMLPAIGFEQYYSYEDYTSDPGNPDDPALFDDCFPLENQELSSLLFDKAPFFDYLITRNAHTPYTYDDPTGRYALEKYPEYRGKYLFECEDVLQAKAHLTDDLFTRLLEELRARGLLENTVIVAFTDHYNYTVDQDLVQKLSGVDNTYQEMRTPCFIWADGLQPMEVDKVLNTADLAPTLLNLFGIDTGRRYLGQDAFDPAYPGYVVFSDGAWLADGVLYADGAVQKELTDGAAQTADLSGMQQTAAAFIRTSDALMESDYYGRTDSGT